MEDIKYYLWLSRVSGMSSRKMDILFSRFKDAREIFNASREELLSSEMIDEKTVDAICKDRSLELIESYIQELKDLEMGYISRFDKDFPVYLNNIQNPPMGLYVLGHLPPEEIPKVGIIGARRCSEYGLTASFTLSRDLAFSKVCIVSGMARGIDSQSHRGALDAGGYTIAVLGCGADVCYPPENKYLKKRIIENGCIVSEYPPKTKPLPAHFPMRNRIISGLSLAVIVVEAAKKSGTNITVDQALEQGREVFAVPGNITSKLSEGTNEFIKQGAIPVSSYMDVLNNLGIKYDNKSEINMQDKRLETLLPVERLIYNTVSEQSVSPEEIAAQTGIDIKSVSSALTLLEMDKFVRKLPGQRYARI